MHVATQLTKNTGAKKPRPRHCWVRPYLGRRVEQGHYDNILRQLALPSPDLYRNLTQIDKELFNQIVERVTPYIQKTRTFFREAMEPGLRLAITLRFLASGTATRGCPTPPVWDTTQ